MKQKMKRWLGALLSIALILGLMPGLSLTAYADGTTYDPASKYTGFGDLITNDTEVTINEVSGKAWYVIACDASTVTLLSKESFENKAFNSSGTGNDYATSEIKTYVDELTEEGQPLAGISSVISDLTLIDTTTAEGLSVTKKKGTGENWWLRSPGYNANNATYVYGGSGDVYDDGSNLSLEFGVRPALKLNLSSVIFSSESKTFSLKPPHTHSFTYSASGATITATCTADGCDLPPGTEGGTDHVAKLSMVAPTLTTYGGTGDATATLDGVADFNTATGKTIATTDIKYVGRGSTTYAESSTAPTNAGTYTAKITVEEKTASLDYEIAKADPTANAPTGLTATYGQTLSDVTLTNPTGNTDGIWAWVSAGTTSVGNAGDNTFKANFTPTDANYKTVENVDVTITVGKAANPATVTGTATVIKGGNTVDLSGSVTKNGATGDVGYAFYGEAKGCTLNGSILTSGNTTGTVTVNVTVAADSNYEALAATPITVTIDDKGTQTITAADVTASYGDTGKSVSATTDGNGVLSYVVKSGDAVTVDESTGALTIVKVGSAVITVMAAETATYAQATKDVNVTVNKANAVVTKAPEAKMLTYNGQAQELVTAGEATGGTMYYAVTTENTAPTDDNLYTTSIPAKTEAGTYYVWYKSMGHEGYTDTEPECVTATITKAGIDVKTLDQTFVYGSSIDFDQSAYEVVLGSAVKGEDLFAVLGRSETNQDEIDISITIKRGDTDTTSNYNIKKTLGKLKISPKELTIKANAGTKEEGEADPALTYEVEGLVDTDKKEDVLEGKLEREPGEDVGTYKVTQGTLEIKSEYADRYTTSFESADFVIKAKPAPETAAPTATPEVTVAPTATPEVTIAPTGTPEATIVPTATPEVTTAPTEKPVVTLAPTEKPAVTEAPTEKPKATAEVTKAPVVPTVVPTSDPTADQEKVVALSLNSKFKVQQKGKKIKISWKKVDGADKYDVFVAYCSKKFSSKPTLSTTKMSVAVSLVSGKKINLKKIFKVYVAAKANGNVLAKSLTGYIAGRLNEKFTNAKAIKIKSGEIKITAGGTEKIKAKTVLEDSKKEQLSDKHAKEFRYASSDEGVATVSSSGVVTGVGTGTCDVYVYSRNVIPKTVKVTVA